MIPYSDLYTLLLREDFWKFLNEFHKNSHEVIHLITTENSGCDFDLEDLKICLFFTFYMWKRSALGKLFTGP